MGNKIKGVETKGARPDIILITEPGLWVVYFLAERGNDILNMRV